MIIKERQEINPLDNVREIISKRELVAMQEQVRQTAIKAYRLIGCTGLSRVDFFVTDDGRVLLNEINTLPGFTSISMYPKLMAACGLEGEKLIEALIKSAFERVGKDV